MYSREESIFAVFLTFRKVESCLSCFAFERLDRVCHALPRFNNRPILHLTIVFYHKYRGQGENEKVPKDQKRDWDEKSPI